MNTLTLSEQEIRTLLVALHGHAYDLSQEVQSIEANPAHASARATDYLRTEYAEVRTLLEKVRTAR